MSKSPRPPVPEPADHQILVIVRKNNPGMSALAILVLLAVGVFWLSQGGSSKAEVAPVSQPEIMRQVESVSSPEKSVVPAHSVRRAESPKPAVRHELPAPKEGSFGRPATFFEPTQDTD